MAAATRRVYAGTGGRGRGGGRGEGDEAAATRAPNRPTAATITTNPGFRVSGVPGFGSSGFGVPGFRISGFRVSGFQVSEFRNSVAGHCPTSSPPQSRGGDCGTRVRTAERERTRGGGPGRPEMDGTRNARRTAIIYRAGRRIRGKWMATARLHTIPACLRACVRACARARSPPPRAWRLRVVHPVRVRCRGVMTILAWPRLLRMHRIRIEWRIRSERRRGVIALRQVRVGRRHMRRVAAMVVVKKIIMMRSVRMVRRCIGRVHRRAHRRGRVVRRAADGHALGGGSRHRGRSRHFVALSALPIRRIR